MAEIVVVFNASGPLPTTNRTTRDYTPSSSSSSLQARHAWATRQVFRGEHGPFASPTLEPLIAILNILLWSINTPAASVYGFRRTSTIYVEIRVDRETAGEQSHRPLGNTSSPI